MTNVDVLLKCIVNACGRIGMWVQDRATVTATQCEFMGNRQSGVYCDGATTKNKIERLHDAPHDHHNGHHGLWAFRAVVDLHGTKNSHPFQQALWYSCSISW